MTIAHSDALKTARMQLISDMVAGKTPAASTGGATAGQLVILDALGGILVAVPLPTTPFAVSGSGTVVATLLGVPLSVLASASGIAARAELRNNAGATITSGLSVGTLGTEIVLTSTTIIAGTNITVTSGVIAHG
jgi:hypothetical protein